VIVLVVDDDLVFRAVVQSMLTKLCRQEVIPAKDGAEAIGIFGASKDQITLVLHDLIMPGMKDWETLELLSSLQPEIPVILFSGYDEAQIRFGDHHE
jgi:CheY-like chemotaxis protein